MSIEIGFDYVNHHLLVPSPTERLDLTDLYEAMRIEEMSVKGGTEPIFVYGEGKGELDTGTETGILLDLTSWEIKFHADLEQVYIIGGSLKRHAGRVPIAQTPGVNIVLIEPVGATIVTPDVAGWTTEEKTALLAKMDDMLGLGFQHTYRRDITYDPDHPDRVLSEVLEQYDSKVNAALHDGSTGFMASWSFSYEYDDDGRGAGILVVKN
ncbi:MAG: hypothetical protein ABIK28_21770 [Planctomycetota bacterium]